jgi:Tfp pilus assembly protein PilO
MNNIVSIIMLVASLGIVWGYARPTYQGNTGAIDFSGKSIKELKVDIKKYNEAEEKIRKVEEKKDGLQTKYNSISEENRDKLKKVLPKEIDMIRLIVDITTHASNYGMALKNIEIGKGPTSNVSNYSRPGEAPVSSSVSSRYPSADLGFEITGSYSKIVDFLGSLEKSLRIVDLSSVTIGLPGVNNVNTGNKTVAPVSNNIYLAKIVLRSYYLSDSNINSQQVPIR